MTRMGPLLVGLFAACESVDEPVPELIPSAASTAGGGSGGASGDSGGAATGSGGGSGAEDAALGADQGAGGGEAGSSGTAGTDAGTDSSSEASAGGAGGSTGCSPPGGSGGTAFDSGGGAGGMTDAGKVGCLTQIALGGDHTCARRVDGTLWCWGSNQDGQLGDGTTLDKHTPVQITALGSAVAEVRAGEHFTCARKLDGTVWCWGWNVAGQLGDGTTEDKHSPVQVKSLGDTDAIALGVHHACARKAQGTLWCWGQNLSGQVGDGTNTNKGTPVQVSALGTSVAEVSLGALHSCARRTDGTLWCWGANGEGQLGDGTSVDSMVPVPVTAFATSCAEVSLGGDHSCARRTGGSLWCWGWNLRGQLGDCTTASKSVPVQVVAVGSAVAEVAAGKFHGCARKTDGTLWCWGWNDSGQLGDGTTVQKNMPFQVVALGGAVAGSEAGARHSCAFKADATLWCWGGNDSGQLGDGTTTDKLVPVQIGVPCP